MHRKGDGVDRDAFRLTWSWGLSFASFYPFSECL